MSDGRNRLASEKSPYLLQHARNPVDWYPWGDEALARARAEDKPIFLSVGYSTCHWCHVMERESFEDAEVAALMNAHFINIKVDREERPDVDRVYMTFVQATTGRGGWPMSVWLTPELAPFFGGTYFPPDGKFGGRPGFASLLTQLAKAWREKRDEIAAGASETVAQLREVINRAAPPRALDDAVARAAFEAFRQSYDERLGGFGGAPKFPRPVTHEFLLAYHARTGDSEAARMVLHTLRAMHNGGMYDQLGGGFHRYSVDALWHVPHFEKMLYDQAQLARSYVDGYQLSGDAALAATARGVLDYVLRDLRDAEHGAFYSAEDADSPLPENPSEQAEGAFYVWTKDEIEALLEADDAALFCEHYAIAAEGNADDPHGELSGKNVLHVVATVEEQAERAALATDDVRVSLDGARARLLQARAARPRPHLDDKVLCAWNGMMIGAFARAGRVLGEPRYIEAAARAARFVRETLLDGETLALWRRYRDGERAVAAYLEDYAQLTHALVELYQARFELDDLLLAERLADHAIERFFDRDEGGFYATDGRDTSVLLRIKDDYDGAEPSGNSVMALELVRLAALVGRDDLRARAEQTIAFFSGRLEQMPQVMPLMLVAAERLRDPPATLVIAGERDADDTRALLGAAERSFRPDMVVLLADEAARAALGERLPYLAAMAPRDGAATAYLCRDQRCEAPTTSADALAAELAAPR
ncbi:MAG: thioredoxin domain-containing protein [Myxococcales bacterium]|nr:thioredoxin domain-containing protein [Myxococcales bacterium]